MPLFEPKQLNSGMKLAEQVTNLDGNVLFKKGLELTDRHIEILMMWGVPQVEVVGEETEPVAALDRFDAATVEMAKKQVAQRFALVRSSHPAVDIIKNISVAVQAHALQRSSSKGR